ncbi:hypothetical protein [Nocardiopsis halotolerans]|uniref:hypothetical protein n=1 Tax=Nocardiopsis halotolerans TaxID=124252 RepID=UPI001360B3D6|nr:hypothetical protein [Nocardiopsis halotolerans]
MVSLVRELGRNRPNRDCSAACGLGSAEVTLLRQVLGLCLSLRVTLAAHCPRGGRRRRA